MSLFGIDQKTFDEHAASDKEQFRAVMDALRNHDEKVDERHEANLAATARVESAITAFDALVPAIKRGIEADQAAIMRIKRLKWILWTTLSTLLVISGLIPLAQLVMSTHFTMSFGGH